MDEQLLLGIQTQLRQLLEQNSAVSSRLEALEEEKLGDRGRELLNIHATAREKSLTLTFGETKDGREDISPTSLRLFLDHYDLTTAQNLRKGVKDWEDKEFRARELRLQLRGKPAEWLAHEQSMSQVWIRNDEEIKQKLIERYMGTQSIELNIIRFEELSQNESEGLSEYMTRCQRYGSEAFGSMDPTSTQQRIVWKFLNGIRDSEVRGAVIKEKWMKTDREAKSYEEVLKIAETAKMSKIATVATGGKTAADKLPKVAAAKVPVKKHQTRSNGARNKQSSSDSGRSSDSSTYFKKCHYCQTTGHWGGWKLCEKRKKEDPDWTPYPKRRKESDDKDF